MPPSEKGIPRLTLDADVHVPAAKALRLRGYDVVSVWEIGEQAVADEVHLQNAAEQGRCLVTFNVGDFSPLHTRWLAEGRHHSGIVVSPQIALGVFLHRCCLFLSTHAASELRDHLLWLPRE
ncbi:MAG: hypothetical protein FJ290_02610 [Planctomycetes bacterium]|nr:hypothetical protein [Planctomycetota bacterium]